MMNLEQRVLSMVQKHLPHSPEADQVEVAAFLTAECWNLINEWVHDYNRQEKVRLRRKGGYDGAGK